MATISKFPLLCGKIVEKFGSRRNFASELGWSQSKLSMKLGGKSDWTRSEMLEVLSKLGSSSSEVELYFFKL